MLNRSVACLATALLAAPIRAAQRADELLAAGDIEGPAVWLGIIEAVKELMTTKPAGQVQRSMEAYSVGTRPRPQNYCPTPYTTY